MVPDVVPPPPPPMPSASYVPPKSTLTIVKSEKAASPPRNPTANSDSFNSVINEIKNKGGTLRKTKRKEVVPVEECIIPPVQNLKSVPTAKPTFKNEIIVNIVPKANIPKLNGTTDVTDNSKVIPCENGVTFKLRRPSDFLNGTKPELPSKQVVLKPQLAPKLSINGIKPANKFMINGTTTNLTNGINIHKKSDIQKPSLPSKVPFALQTQPPQKRPSLVSSTIQRLTSVEPESPTESSFKRNQVLTRSTSGGINSTIQKLAQQTSETDANSTASIKFQRSNSVRQRINQMNKVEHQIPVQIKDGTQTVGRRPMVPRPNLPRPSNATMKFLNEFNSHNLNGNTIKLENEEARVGTTVHVADINGTVTTGDPNVKKLVYSTYRNLLGAYNNKANVMVTNQNDTMVVQDRGVADRLVKISQNGTLQNLTGRAIQKNDD